MLNNFFFFSFLRSKSPLNGQAAMLWDSDKAEYKRLLAKRYAEREEDDDPLQ